MLVALGGRLAHRGEKKKEKGQTNTKCGGCKRAPGARWRPSAKYWCESARWRSLRSLRDSGLSPRRVESTAKPNSAVWVNTGLFDAHAAVQTSWTFLRAARSFACLPACLSNTIHSSLEGTGGTFPNDASLPPFVTHLKYGPCRPGTRSARLRVNPNTRRATHLVSGSCANWRKIPNSPSPQSPASSGWKRASSRRPRTRCVCVRVGLSVSVSPSPVQPGSEPRTDSFWHEHSPKVEASRSARRVPLRPRVGEGIGGGVVGWVGVSWGAEIRLLAAAD